MNNIYAKAYTELYEILKYISEEDFNKIPKEVLNMLEEKRDRNYEFQLQENANFENQCLLRETKVLLAILYRDYWATEKEKERIIQKWKYDIKKEEEEKRLRYNVNIFQKDSINKCNNHTDTKLMVEIKKINIFQRIISFIKGYLKL